MLLIKNNLKSMQLMQARLDKRLRKNQNVYNHLKLVRIKPIFQNHVEMD